MNVFLRKFKVYISSVVIFTTLLFSCQSKTKSSKNVFFEDVPIAKGSDLNLKYTDSGRLTAILKTPVVLDFTHKSQVGYQEFPKGVRLTLFDEKGDTTVVTSEYGVSYQTTGLIDLRGDVHIRMADSTHLQSEQLYWDQKESWVFTDHPYKVIFSNGSYNDGDGFDANQDFTNFRSRTNVGTQVLEEE